MSVLESNIPNDMFNEKRIPNDMYNMDTKRPIIDTIWLKAATPVRFIARQTRRERRKIARRTFCEWTDRQNDITIVSSNRMLMASSTLHR